MILRIPRLHLFWLAVGLAVFPWPITTIPLTADETTANSSSDEWPTESVKLAPHQGREHPPVITALSIHPSGRYVAMGGDDHVVRVWDLQDKVMVMILEGHSDWVRTLSFSPRGDLLVSSGNDHRVVVWNMETGEIRREYSQLTHVVTSVVFSNDGNLVAVVGFGDKLRIIDGTTGDRLREYDCPTADMRTVAFSPDDSMIVGGGRNGVIRIWEASMGKVLGEFPVHSQRIRDLAFSRDGQLMATCGEDRKVVISRVNGEEPFSLPRQSAKVMSLVFCGPNQLATGGSDNVIRIWDLASKKEVAQLRGHTGTIAVLASRDDLLVSSGFDATVRVWTRPGTLLGSTHGAFGRVGRR